jgi:hypothetical protein
MACQSRFPAPVFASSVKQQSVKREYVWEAICSSVRARHLAGSRVFRAAIQFAVSIQLNWTRRLTGA